MTTERVVSGKTRLYGIVGDPIEQVAAPEAFNPYFAENEIDAVMLPVHVRPDDVRAALDGFAAIANLHGLIITIPHKFAFAELMDEMGLHGQLVGAVNAIRQKPDGTWIGDLFDGIGFVEGLRTEGIDPNGKSFLIYGAGGAGTAIGGALLDVLPSRISIFDPVPGKAERLCEILRKAAPTTVIEAADAQANPADYEIVVNSTPLGMKESDPLPFNPDRLIAANIVAEVVMKPPITPILKEAKKRGCRIHPGRHMLQGQFFPFLRFFGLPT
ncbi:MAG: shikimate dehydrogenase [Rhodospirillales bacterium]|nr:shikimate dehydrogenase [Rhodospirillales bacterium]